MTIPTKTDNVGSKIFTKIYSSIMDLSLLPGTKISEQILAEQLEVSRTPVREALVRLFYMGLVDIQPQRGTFISLLDMENINNGLFLRRNIEEGIIKEIVHVFPNSSIDKSYQCIEKQKNSLDEKNMTKNYKLDQQFHKEFFRVAKRLNLWDVITVTNHDYNRARLLSLELDNKMEIICSEHEKLLEAIIKKDIESAIAVLQNHVSQLEENEEQDLLTQFPEYFKQKFYL